MSTEVDLVLGKPEYIFNNNDIKNITTLTENDLEFKCYKNKVIEYYDNINKQLIEIKNDLNIIIDFSKDSLKDIKIFKLKDYIQDMVYETIKSLSNLIKLLSCHFTKIEKLDSIKSEFKKIEEVYLEYLSTNNQPNAEDIIKTIKI